MPDKDLDAYALFRLESDLRGPDYEDYVYIIMAVFFGLADYSLNAWKAYELAFNGGRWNKKGSLAELKIDGINAGKCKMYYFNENACPRLKRSILFVASYSEENKKAIMTIADSFEKFLKSKNIEHSRQYRPRRKCQKNKTA